MEIDTRSLNASHIFAGFFFVQNIAHFLHVTILPFSVKLSYFCLHSLEHVFLSVTMEDDVMEEKWIYIRQRGILAA